MTRIFDSLTKEGFGRPRRSKPVEGKMFAYLFLLALCQSWTIPIPVLLAVTVGVLSSYLGIGFPCLSCWPDS